LDLSECRVPEADYRRTFSFGAVAVILAGAGVLSVLKLFRPNLQSQHFRSISIAFVAFW
jgi:hypothetical protein